LLQALQTNPAMRANELAEITNKLSSVESSNATATDTAAADGDDEVVQVAVVKFLEENAAELIAEQDKPFKPIGMSLDEEPAIANASAAAAAPSETKHGAAPEEPAHTVTADEAKMRAAAAAAMKAKAAQPADRRDSVLQKISKLDIRGRITLAMRGTKEERSILVRDSTKLVAIAVLDSPKVSDGEVEKFALQKNVLEAVLRAIPMRRKFAKNYNIMRNLVQNPRTPLDLSLGLMKNLLVHDLKNLSGNKEVSDTIRKTALRMFKQKVEKKG
jgi:hypothetical protein